MYENILYIFYTLRLPKIIQLMGINASFTKNPIPPSAANPHAVVLAKFLISKESGLVHRREKYIAFCLNALKSREIDFMCGGRGFDDLRIELTESHFVSINREYFSARKSNHFERLN